jgi:hypothetical protein
MVADKRFGARLAEMEEAFRAFRRARLDVYEAELDRARSIAELVGRETEAPASAGTRGGGAGRQAPEGRDAEATLARLLEVVRPPLVDREADMAAGLRERAAHAAFFSRFGWQQAHLLGADRLSPDPAKLASLEGEVTNPAKWLYEAGKLEVSDSETGTETGCEPPGLRFQERIQWYYTWLPPKTGRYAILAGQYHHGFYVVHSQRTPGACQSAAVRAYAELELHQYFSRGKLKRWVIDQAGETITKAGVLDGSVVWSFAEQLGGDDPVNLTVLFDVGADARGAGAHAEIDFETGKANHVEAPFVFFLPE